MRSNISAALILSLGVPGLSVNGPVQAADNASTAATLSCVPAGMAAPATLPGCLISAHTQLEIAKCTGLAPGSCFGPSNDIRKAGRWLDENVTRKVLSVFGIK